MCSHDVVPEAEQALARLLTDIAAALWPEDPQAVQVGPVDFGCRCRGTGWLCDTHQRGGCDECEQHDGSLSGCPNHPPL